MTITSVNPLSGTVVEVGAIIEIVSNTPLSTIVYRREGYSDDTIYSSSTFQTGFTGSLETVGTTRTYRFRRNAGWDVSPFQVDTSDGVTEATAEYYIVQQGEYPLHMRPFGWGGGGDVGRINHLDDIGDVNAPDPDDLDVVSWDDATRKWISRPPGTPGPHTLDSHSDVILTTPDADEVLVFNGAVWVNGPAPEGGVVDHGLLTGLGDDDHTQYVLATGVRNMERLTLSEQSSIPTPQILEGTLWVRNTTPQQLVFTNEDGDQTILSIGQGGTDWVSTLGTWTIGQATDPGEFSSNAIGGSMASTTLITFSAENTDSVWTAIFFDELNSGDIIEVDHPTWGVTRFNITGLAVYDGGDLTYAVPVAYDLGSANWDVGTYTITVHKAGVPSGSGDVVGPAGASTNNIAVFADMTGKLIKSASGASVDALGTILATRVNASGTIQTGNEIILHAVTGPLNPTTPTDYGFLWLRQSDNRLIFRDESEVDHIISLDADSPLWIEIFGSVSYQGPTPVSSGALWVNLDFPTKLFFRDDNGVDHDLTATGAGVADTNLGYGSWQHVGSTLGAVTAGQWRTDTAVPSTTTQIRISYFGKYNMGGSALIESINIGDRLIFSCPQSTLITGEPPAHQFIVTSAPDDTGHPLDYLVGVSYETTNGSGYEPTLSYGLILDRISAGPGGSVLIQDKGVPEGTVTTLNFDATMGVSVAAGVATISSAAGGGNVSAANSPNSGEIARWTGSQTIEGLTESEFKAAVNLEIGTDVAAQSHVGAGGAAHANVIAAGAAGFMTGADKTKLDGVATGANLYVHPNHTGDVTSTGDGATVIAADVVTNAKLANMNANTVKVNATAGSDNPTDIALPTNTLLGRLAGNIEAVDATEATALLNTFTSTLKGLAPISGGGTTNYLRADGTWTAPPGGGTTDHGALTGLTDDDHAQYVLATGVRNMEYLSLSEQATGPTGMALDGKLWVQNTTPQRLVFTTEDDVDHEVLAGLMTFDQLDAVVTDENLVAQDFTRAALKTTPVAADTILINDSAAAGVMKRTTLTDLLGGGGGPETNTLTTVCTGIADDQIPVGASANVAAYKLLPNGVVKYSTSTNAFSAAALSDFGLDADLATFSVAASSSVSGSNTGDQTITLTGDVTGSGTGSFATTIATDAVDIAMLSATGTADSTTYLRGDNTWATPAGGGPTTSSLKAVGIPEPASSTSYPLFKTDQAMTFTELEATAIGTSPSVVWTLHYGATLLTSDGTIGTNTTDGTSPATDTMAISVAVPANSHLWITTGTVGGTVDQFNLTMTFTAQAARPRAVVYQDNSTVNADTFTLLTTISGNVLGVGTWLINYSIQCLKGTATSWTVYVYKNTSAGTELLVAPVHTPSPSVTGTLGTVVASYQGRCAGACIGTFDADDTLDIYLAETGASTTSVTNRVVTAIQVSP